MAEAELSIANMMLLYEKGFNDFSFGGFCFTHQPSTSMLNNYYD